MWPQPSSFANEKALRFVITLGIGRGSFSGGYQTLTLEGLRASIHIEMAGGAMMPTLRAQIYGMTASDMNAATTTKWGPQGSSNFNLLPNTIAAYAIDGSQETLVFSGNIVEAWGIYEGMPEVYLMVQAQGWYLEQLTPANPIRTTITSDSQISTVMQQIADNLGMNFENNGVAGTVRKGQTLSGSYVEQAQQMAQAYRAQFAMYMDPTSNTLAITPVNTPRAGNAPLISANTGLIGYPIFNGVGVEFDTLFNPAIKFGGAVQVRSAIPKANGVWYATSITHTLESQTPGGQWRSTVYTINSPNAVATTLPVEN